MQENFRLESSAARTKAESIDEMRIAEALTSGLLFLTGCRTTAAFQRAHRPAPSSRFQRDMQCRGRAIDRCARHQCQCVR